MSSAPEHRDPLGQLRIEPNVQSAVPIDLKAPTARDNVHSVDDLASSMAKKLQIVDDDDDFDENVNGGKLQTVDWKKENKEMDKMFESQSKQQLQDLPPFEQPKGFKKSVTFYDHQKDGIRWLLQQEQNAPPNPFVRERTLKDGSVASLR